MVLETRHTGIDQRKDEVENCLPNTRALRLELKQLGSEHHRDRRRQHRHRHHQLHHPTYRMQVPSYLPHAPCETSTK
jgi:hypothetical protein